METERGARYYSVRMFTLALFALLPPSSCEWPAASTALAPHVSTADGANQDSNESCDVNVVCFADSVDEEFDRARKLLDEGKCDAAASAFAEIVERDPAHGLAWFFYGYCVHVSANDAATEDERIALLERALQLHLRAAEFDDRRPSALYNAACACALLGDTEEAFHWLDEAFQNGFASRYLLRTDKDLKSLHGDPRFDAYLPDQPYPSKFKGDVRVLHTFYGESPGDQFGSSGRNAGDCDGDGKDDIVISAPYKKVKGANAGKVYVYSGATGELIFECSGKPGEKFGVGLDAAGDVNDDGHADIIVGGSYSRNRSGKAYVFSGKDGQVLLELNGFEAGDQFGTKVTGTGDFDGDGYADLLIGAPGSDQEGLDAGRAYLFSGKNGDLLATVDGERPGDSMGTCVAGTKSGVKRLLAVGAANAGRGQRGRVYVYEFIPRENTTQSLEPLFGIESDATGVHLGGMFLSFVGDIDGDGWSDVYASDWENNAHGRTTGRVYVHSGRTGDRLLTLTGDRAGDGFGIGPGRAGDVNGDGFDDLIIGAWRNSDGAPMAGKCYLYSGIDGTLLEDFVCTVEGDTFGFDAVGMGDLDGDGGTDYLITCAWSSSAGKKAGRAVVIAGPTWDAVTTATKNR